MFDEPDPDEGDEATEPGGAPSFASLSDYELVGELGISVLAAASGYSRRLSLIGALYRRPVMQPPAAEPGAEPGAERGVWSREELTAAEIQPPLRIDAEQARGLVRRAVALTGRLSRTLALLAQGRLDEARADVIADKLAPVLDDAYDTARGHGASPREAEESAQALAHQFEARLLTRAPGQTLDLLRHAIARAIHRLAREYEAAQRQDRVRRRDVTLTCRGQEEGTAFLGAHLPVVEAQACYAELDSCARALRRQGDARPLDALRADLLIARILHRNVFPAGPLREITHDTGSPGRSDEAFLNHLFPDDEPQSGDPGGGRPSGWTPGRAVARGVTAHIQITLTLETLLGLDEHAAHLSGYGPISAQVARAAAMQAGSIWRRLVTDPLDGRLLDYGRTTYRPPVALADHVIARDVHCSHPGCSKPAELGDVDHIVPYPFGTTNESNLRSICRRHHRLKHETGWQADLSTDPLDPPGTVVVTSRTGQQYKTRPPDLRPDDRTHRHQEQDHAHNRATRDQDRDQDQDQEDEPPY